MSDRGPLRERLTASENDINCPHRCQGTRLADDLLIVPRDAALPYYLSWFEQRQLPAPALSSLGIFVASKGQGPIAGVGVYVTDGPYFFLENLATAPSLPKKLRHRAVLALAEQARILGAIMNKHPLLSANSTGLVRTLVRGGFNISRSVPMWGTPVVEIRGLKREVDGAHEHRPRKGPAPRRKSRKGVPRKRSPVA